jgi:hypothetical protein
MLQLSLKLSRKISFNELSTLSVENTMSTSDLFKQRLQDKHTDNCLTKKSNRLHSKL